MPPLQAMLLLALAGLARADMACDYPVSDVVRFTTAETISVEFAGAAFDVSMTSINVGFGTSAISSIDVFDPACQFGNCPVLLKGTNLDKILSSIASTNADVLCYFGPELPCASVPTIIRSDELACATPTLPASHAIVPFGVLVLLENGVPPGTLFLPTDLELTFYDTSRPPIIHRLEPPTAAVTEVPQRVSVIGANFGPGRTGLENPIQCLWYGEETSENPVVHKGSYFPDMQTIGDGESWIDCRGGYPKLDRLLRRGTLRGGERLRPVRHDDGWTGHDPDPRGRREGWAGGWFRFVFVWLFGCLVVFVPRSPKNTTAVTRT